MTGKSYTMREMKTIVEYLTEHKAYGEMKGRKMWIEFASTRLTNRTWQSLKETFLKRILPDIHNPYYKLTRDQIISFRQGYDIEAKEQNKLEIHTISEDSNSNAENNKDTEQPSTSNNNEGEKATGEDTKSSKISSRNRSSADTVVLENCYETADEIRRELESPNPAKETKDGVARTKSIRDFITYSEPLTPMLQEVLDDFATESEGSDKETQMQNVETSDTNNQESNNQKPISPTHNVEANNVTNDVGKNANFGLSAEVVEEVLISKIHDSTTQPMGNRSPKLDKPQNDIEANNAVGDNSNIVSLHSEKDTDRVDGNAVSQNRTESNANNTENHVATDEPKSNTKEDNNITHEINEKSTQNCSNNTTDTVLPNNQEGLEPNTVQTQKEINTQDLMNVNNKPDEKVSRKRSSSPLELENKRKKETIELENERKKEDDKPIDTEKDNGAILTTTNNTEKHSTENLEQLVNDSDVEIIPDSHVHEKPQEKATTSAQIDEPNIITETIGSDKDKSPQPKNPCLKSVSLFAEQFNETKYSDSESSEVAINTTNRTETEQKTVNSHTEVVKENIVLLKSHSESESHHEQDNVKKNNVRHVSKSQRDKALANVFGFSSGAVTSNRKTRLSLKRSNPHHRLIENMGSESSEWTSESESDDYVSPPRGRRNRHTKKFLKPKSARILSLEEEGGLFVMYGKRIYPLVKDGKIVKNYVTYTPDSDSEFEDETYWKIKYEEEKKKSEELKKLLEAKEPTPRDRLSPILPSNLHRHASTPQQRQPVQNLNKSSSKDVNTVAREERKDINGEKIKIKFTRNNEEVHLEGHWPQIHPALEQVVNIFHKESDAQVNHAKQMLLDATEQSKEIGSRESTPIIPTVVEPEVHEKVNKIEQEIFEKIEEIDKGEKTKPIEQENKTKPIEQESNVTTRKLVKQRKASTSSKSTNSPAKRAKTSQQVDEPATAEGGNQLQLAEPENNAPSVTTRRTRTPRKITNETANTETTRPIRTRRSKHTEPEATTNNVKVEDDNEVRYMLPPANKSSLNRSTLNNSRKEQKPRRRYLKKHTDISSPDNLSHVSESTQGYQDSDISPMKLRKKRKLSLHTIQHRGKHQYSRKNRRKSYPYLYQDFSTDSSNSSYNIPVRNETAQNSSEVYKSDSYRFLLPQQKISFRCLEKIDETDPIMNEFNTDMRHVDSVSKDQLNIKSKAKDTNSTKVNTDVGSSSNISLPMSPELSVVENISVSNELLSGVEDHPTINETQANDATQQHDYRGSKYMISEVDVTVPLMEQMCELYMSIESKASGRINKSRKRASISESLLNKICSVNIEDNCTISDSLDRKLQNLLLESAKKMSKVSTDDQTKQDMEVDDVPATKKSKAKKRCSTPRKKKAAKKSKIPKVDAVVEEKMESCTYGGRKSCPPSIQVFDDNAMDFDENFHNNNIVTKPVGRKKKDIIKVKIQRPRDKSRSNEKLDKQHSVSKMSICTDSGINDTESEIFLPVFNDSIELIHNHSETCLHTNECIGNSVEFVENTDTVISLCSNSMLSGDGQGQSYQFQDAENRLSQVLHNNVQDVTMFCNVKSTPACQVESTGETIYYSPANTDVLNASLITDDLSDEIPTKSQPRATKWYLFSEDETTNTNMCPCPQSSSGAGFGANLRQLFPIACAVPDLSTITEMSRENDDSRKPTLDTDGVTRDFDTQNIFNI